MRISLTKHAEEVAVLVAFAGDKRRQEVVGPRCLAFLYVAGLLPCGSCRQFAAEFATDQALWVLEPIRQEDLSRPGSLLELPDDRQPTVVPFDSYLPSALTGEAILSREGW